MKQRILKSIYQSFDSWAADIKIACHRGCATCCTQDVTMTEIEGSYIVDDISTSGRLDWLADKVMKQELPLHPPLYTTNEFAQACLDGKDIDPGMGIFDRSCPFLENNNCTIYETRPFSCRSFVSQQVCQPGSSAVIPQYYLSAATAVSQLIEHLAQHQYWGNMLHLLYAIIQKRGYGQDKNKQDACKHNDLYHHYLLRAKPLPGFLLSDDERVLVTPLLDQILTTQIGARTIEQLLNGK